MRIRHLVLAVVTGTALLLSGCTGDGGDDATPAELGARLATAKKALDAAETIEVSLSTSRLPNGVTGLLSAKGRGHQAADDRPAAFEGEVTVVTGGASLAADVVAIDDDVWAKTSFSPDFLSIDPETLKAPNPASLLGDRGAGLPEILVETDALEQGDRSRDGEDVLTAISGTIPGATIARFLPSADESGSFSVVYRVDDDDVLRDATISGPFYPDADDVTYTVTLRVSDAPVEIEPPTRAGA